MPIITIETTVKAPVDVCFDLSRSIDLHTISTKHTGERAVAGVTAGLIELGETVTHDTSLIADVSYYLIDIIS